MIKVGKSNVSKPAGIVVLPLLFFLAALFLPFVQKEAFAQEKINKIEDYLPSNTLFYSCVDDLALAKENESSMPIYKILNEKEVADFLKKPKEFIAASLDNFKKEAEKDKALKNLDLDFRKFCDGDIGRIFVALTHVGIPNVPVESDVVSAESLIPDIGFVIGVEYKDPDKNLIQFIKKTVVSVSTAKGFPIQIVDSEYNGVPFEKVVLPLPFPVATPCFFKLGKMDLLTTSFNSMKEILDRQIGVVTDCLSKSELFNEGTKYVDFTHTSTTRGYLNVKELTSLLERTTLLFVGLKKRKSKNNGKNSIDMILKDFPQKLEKLIDLLGVRGIDAVFCSDISKDGLATSYKYVSLNSRVKGLLSLSPEVPISEEKLKLIPKEAVSFSISQFDVAGLYDLILQGIKTLDEQTHTKVLGAIDWLSMALAGENKDNIVNVRNDILGSIGTEFIAYKLKPKGMTMMGTPPVFFFISVKNYKRFAESVKSLINGLENLNPDIGSSLSLKTVNFENHEICYIQFKKIPIPIQPSFTKIGDYIVFSFDAKELKRLIKMEGIPKESILENVEFMSNYRRLPGDRKFLSISYTNVAEEFGSAYEQISPMIPMITMGIPPEIELPFDFMLLPTSECIKKHLFGSLTVSYKEGNGWKKIHYGPFGPELGRVVVPAIATTLIAGVYYYRESKLKIEKKRVEEGKKGQRSKDISDPILVVRKDLGSLAGACTVFSIAHHGEFPNALEDLLIPTEEYPEGFFPPKKIPNDPWNNPYHYKRLKEDQKKYMIWSAGPNGKNEEGQGDDIVKIK